MVHGYEVQQMVVPAPRPAEWSAGQGTLLVLSASGMVLHRVALLPHHVAKAMIMDLPSDTRNE